MIGKELERHQQFARVAEKIGKPYEGISPVVVSKDEYDKVKHIMYGSPFYGWGYAERLKRKERVALIKDSLEILLPQLIDQAKDQGEVKLFEAIDYGRNVEIYFGDTIVAESDINEHGGIGPTGNRTHQLPKQPLFDKEGRLLFMNFLARAEALELLEWVSQKLNGIQYRRFPNRFRKISGVFPTNDPEVEVDYSYGEKLNVPLMTEKALQIGWKSQIGDYVESKPVYVAFLRKSSGSPISPEQ